MSHDVAALMERLGNISNPLQTLLRNLRLESRAGVITFRDRDNLPPPSSSNNSGFGNTHGNTQINSNNTQSSGNNTQNNGSTNNNSNNQSRNNQNSNDQARNMDLINRPNNAVI